MNATTVPRSTLAQYTDEQRAAQARLRALAAPFRFRVTRDAEGFPIIPGRGGPTSPCEVPNDPGRWRET